MTKKPVHLLLALALSWVTVPGLAGNSTDDQAATPLGAPPCPGLMTQQECGQHQSTIAKLGPGPALESYLSEFEAEQRDREAACSCDRKLPPESRYAPHRQALMRHP